MLHSFDTGQENPMRVCSLLVQVPGVAGYQPIKKSEELLHANPKPVVFVWAQLILPASGQRQHYQARPVCLQQQS